ncbi:MAG: hypothetical protein KJP05_09915 [Deltaproteobacteria bacterium]|nr:hypothetical protein [Deltaproteobacteria bacterium]
MKELTSEERAKMAAELEELHGQIIANSTSESYEKEPAAIGTTLTYLDCGCLVLRPFDERGDIIGDSKILETGDPCSVDHSVSLESAIQDAAYNSILWKDDPEEFDRKYGNEKRIDIASKVFPPPTEE